ncbi:MAG: hypothetical protein ACLQDQ_04380 [Myxococcaceae bacterium]
MPFLLAAAALAGAACSPCPSTRSALVLSDGGAVRCVTSEDCPRTGNDTVCVTTGAEDYTSTCVLCASTACVRVSVSCP